MVPSACRIFKELERCDEHWVIYKHDWLVGFLSRQKAPFASNDAHTFLSLPVRWLVHESSCQEDLYAFELAWNEADKPRCASNDLDAGLDKHCAPSP